MGALTPTRPSGRSLPRFGSLMIIRKVQLHDAPAIGPLLDQLGYPETLDFLAERVKALANDPEEELLVGEQGGVVVAVLSLHFIPQLATQGSFARISYFCVDQDVRRNGIGRLLEEYAEAAARSRGCDRIEVHCHSRRTDAHRFYLRQGYEEVPKYFTKKLT